MVKRIHQPNIQLTTQQRTGAVSTWRATHEWAKRYNPYPLLRKHPDMSVAQAFKQLRDEDETHMAALRERLHITATPAAEAGAGADDADAVATPAGRTDGERAWRRLYHTPYRRLDAHEQAQLRVLLDADGHGDVIQALADNPDRRAGDLIALTDRPGMDLAHAWLDTLPADRPATAAPRPVGAYLAALRAHEGKWRMWGEPDTRAMALTAAQELRRRAGAAFTVRTRVIDEYGHAAVFASYQPKDRP